MRAQVSGSTPRPWTRVQYLRVSTRVRGSPEYLLVGRGRRGGDEEERRRRGGGEEEEGEAGLCPGHPGERPEPEP